MTGAGPAPQGPPIGHNRGPTLEPGTSWRRHCWQAARARLLPTLPIEVVRLRVRRAADLGLDYTTYASVRAASGHDVVAFLFSSNALRVVRGAQLPDDRAEKLGSLIAVGRVGLATLPLMPEALRTAAPCLDDAHAAPWALAPFAQIARELRTALGRVPGDRVILVGDGILERDWCAAGRLGWYLPAERYFPAG